jgi:hypothetical protein
LDLKFCVFVRYYAKVEDHVLLYDYWILSLHI